MFKRVVLFFFMGFLVGLSAQAGVVMKLTATNPSEFEEQKVTVRSYLPKKIKPEEVIDRGGLELAYDVKQGQYYVYKEVKLKPKESITYRIEIEDIWLIEEEKLNAFKAHSEDLIEKLKKTEYIEVSSKLKDMIEVNISTILEKQANSTIDKVSPIKHIGAYEQNQELMEMVKEDVGTLENLVISLGGDPGVIMGESSMGAKTVNQVLSEAIERLYGGRGDGADGESAEGLASTKSGAAKKDGSAVEAGGYGDDSSVSLSGFKVIGLKVEVENPSGSEAQSVPVKYFLPEDIKAVDVIDAGELELGFDFERELYYLFKEQVKLEPGEKKIFEVLLKDKWSINELDLLSLKMQAENMVEALEGLEEFEETRELAKDIRKKLEELLEAGEKSELTDDHVSAFKEDAKKLEDIKKDIKKMEKVLVQAGVIPEITTLDEKKLRQAAEDLGISEARLRQVQKMKEIIRKTGEDVEDGGLGARGVKLLAGTIFKGKAPTTAATWKIIFIIIGFLAVVSFIFFLTWSAQVQKAKKIEKISGEKK